MKFSAEKLAKTMFPEHVIPMMEMPKEDLLAAEKLLKVRTFVLSNGKKASFYVTKEGFVSDADLSELGAGFDQQEMYTKFSNALSEGKVSEI